MRLEEILTVVCICLMMAMNMRISQDQWILRIHGRSCCETEGTVMPTV